MRALLSGSLSVIFMVGLVACGDPVVTSSGGASGADATVSTGAATDDSAATGSSDSGAAEPTTGVGPVDCACPSPSVFDGHLTVTNDTVLSDPCIVEVTGVLKINGVTDPSVLQPLAHLRRADSVLIDDNPGLVDLDVMSCLEEVNYLRVGGSPSLVDLSALARLRTADFVAFERMPILALPTFAPDFVGASDLVLWELPEVVDIDPIASWPSTGGLDVWISGLPKLTSIAALAGPLGPAPEESRIALRELPSLTSLVGLEAITTGRIELVDLPKITSLAPLDALTDAPGLEVNRLAALTSLEGLQNVESAWDLRLIGLPGLSSLGGLEALQTATRLQLGGCGEGDGVGISDLSGLAALTTVGDLMIFRNPKLAALTGAPALASVVRADLVDNPKLGAAAVADFEAQVSPGSVCHGDQRRCGCLRRAPGGLDQGCASGWSGGADVQVTGAGGPLAGATAFFGWNAYYSQALDPWLELVVLDGAASIEVAIGDGSWPPPEAARPQLRFTGSLPYQSWIGSELGSVSLSRPEGSATQAQAQVTVTDRLGDWVTFDPEDPPRIVGFIETLDPDADTLVEGPFEAAYCGAFTRLIPI